MTVSSFNANVAEQRLDFIAKDAGYKVQKGSAKEVGEVIEAKMIDTNNGNTIVLKITHKSAKDYLYQKTKDESDCLKWFRKVDGKLKEVIKETSSCGDTITFSQDREKKTSTVKLERARKQFEFSKSFFGSKRTESAMTGASSSSSSAETDSPTGSTVNKMMRAMRNPDDVQGINKREVERGYNEFLRGITSGSREAEVISNHFNQVDSDLSLLLYSDKKELVTSIVNKFDGVVQQKFYRLRNIKNYLDDPAAGTKSAILEDIKNCDDLSTLQIKKEQFNKLDTEVKDALLLKLSARQLANLNITTK